MRPPLGRCPYCGADTVLSPTSAHRHHGRDYGPIWECVPCDAYVGCHAGSTHPKGTVAMLDDRILRMAAHRVFDPLWAAKMRRDGVSKNKARRAAYQWLAAQLGRDEVHIGWLIGKDLEAVIEACAPYARRLNGGRPLR